MCSKELFGTKNEIYRRMEISNHRQLNRRITLHKKGIVLKLLKRTEMFQEKKCFQEKTFFNEILRRVYFDPTYKNSFELKKNSNLRNYNLNFLR